MNSLFLNPSLIQNSKKSLLSKAVLALLLVAPSLLSTQASAKTADKALTNQFMASTIDDGIVAIVNDSPILKSDLNITMRSLAQQYKNRKQDTPTSEQLKKMALDSLIIRNLQLSRIKRAGIRPSDSAINARMAEFAQSQGVSSITALQQVMDAKKAGSYAKLRRRIVEDISIQSVRQSQVASRAKISKQDVDAFLASPEGNQLNKNQYQTVHVRIPFPQNYNSLSSNQIQKMQSSAMTVAKKIQNELRLTNNNDNSNIVKILANAKGQYPVEIQGGNMGFHTTSSLPTDLANNIVKLDVNQVSEPVMVAQGIDIIKLADKKVATDMVIPQWRTRHILVSLNDLQNEQMAKLRIDDLYEQLQTGADFAKLASTYSNDPGSAGKGGDLDWVSEGNMVPEFEKMMKKTVVSDFSTPFKSKYGWHILQVIDKRQYDASNEIRQKMAQEILFKRAIPQIQEDWLQELKSSAYINILTP